MKVLIKAQAGSHLFGTNTPSSDMDYKGVFLPEADQILLGSYSEFVSKTTGDSNSKNSKDDIDIELYSLKKFLKMVSRGDTAALELLFTPDDMIIEKDPLWDEVLQYRDQLISSKVSAMIGYARQQANKYGIKGSRMGELSGIIDKLQSIEKKFDFKEPKLKHAWDEVVEAVKDYDHVHIIELITSKNMENTKVPALDILGKKFDYHCSFPYVLNILKKVYRNFGQRAREAKKNGGIDWKALSHAVRVSFQGIELLQTGKITLPLRPNERKIVKAIKSGELDYSKKVQPMLESLLEGLEIARNDNKLKKEVEQKLLDDILIKFHKKVIAQSKLI